MKKIVFIKVLCCICLLWVIMPTPGHANEMDLAPGAKSAVLMDATTGTVIYAKNSHAKLAPASVTKVMTLLLTMEALSQNKIRLTDKVRTSENAASMGGTQIFLKPGEEMSVQDLVKGIAIASANDAAVAMAEYLAGSESQFVAQMNRRAKQIGCKDTHFANTNGLPVKNHYTSAHDIALMSYELLKHKKILQYTGLYEDYLRKDTSSPFWLVNTNKLIKLYPGADGLKTGFTQEAKYCLTATAKKGTFRAIAVVMGEPDIKTRNKEVMAMLDHAFSQYSNLLLYEKNEMIARKRIKKSTVDQLIFRAPEDIGLLLKKGQAPVKVERSLQWIKTEAPIKKGERVGRLSIKQNGKLVRQIDLRSDRNLEKAGLWSSLKRTARDIWLQD